MLLLLPLLLVGCATEPDVATPQEVLHTGSGTVLESPQHGPELCSDVAQSLPPQCSGVPLSGWDWAAAEGAESRNGTTWGEYAVTGRWDGVTLTLTQPPGPSRTSAGPSDEIVAGCRSPEAGGTGGIAQEDLERTISAARAEPGHSGAWVDGSTLTLAFTGDLSRHEERARRTWSGPLCVVEHERSLADLARLQDELREDPGLGVTSSWTSEDRNVVGIGVVAITADQQRALDERYGAGTVEVTPLLRPVR